MPLASIVDSENNGTGVLWARTAAGNSTTTDVRECTVRIIVSEFRSRSNRQSRLKLAMAAALTAMLAICAPFAQAEQLSSDAKASIPHDVQQIIMVDYRAMQNSPAAMSLKDRVMPPELKRLEQALLQSGLKVDEDTDALAFVSFRTPNPGRQGRRGGADCGHRAGPVPHPRRSGELDQEQDQAGDDPQQQHLSHGGERLERGVS